MCTNNRYEDLKAKDYSVLDSADKAYFKEELATKIAKDADYKEYREGFLGQDTRHEAAFHLLKCFIKFPELRKLDKDTRKEVMNIVDSKSGAFH